MSRTRRGFGRGCAACVCLLPHSDSLTTMPTVDEYLDVVAQPQRGTLDVVRQRLRALLPGAEEGISYGVPTFLIDGVGIAGYSASKNHCSYFPMSGSVLSAVADRLEGFTFSKGALRFGIDEPLPEELLALLVQVRLDEVAAKQR